MSRVCDGATDCPQGEDELACGEGFPSEGGRRCWWPQLGTATPPWPPCVTSTESSVPADRSNQTGGPCAEYTCGGGDCVTFQQVWGVWETPTPPSATSESLPRCAPLPSSASPRCRRCVTGCRTARLERGPPGMSRTAGRGGPGGPGAPAPCPAAPACSGARGAATSAAPVCCTAAAGRPRRSGSASASPAPVSGLRGSHGWGAQEGQGVPVGGVPGVFGASHSWGCLGHLGVPIARAARGFPWLGCLTDLVVLITLDDLGSAVAEATWRV